MRFSIGCPGPAALDPGRLSIRFIYRPDNPVPSVSLPAALRVLSVHRRHSGEGRARRFLACTQTFAGEPDPERDNLVLSSTRTLACSLLVLLGIPSPIVASPAKPHAAAKTVKADTAAHSHDPSFYDYTLPSADGTSLALSGLRGKTILLVNLARLSEYTSQLAALDTLSKNFAAKGLVVLGVPSNDFGAEEPGTDAEVRGFYAAQKLSFRVLNRATLRGVQELPLYSFLTSGKTMPAGGDVHWNFTKFLINGKGEVITRFNPDVSPDSSELLSTVEQVLNGTYAPPKKDKPGEDESEIPE